MKFFVRAPVCCVALTLLAGTAAAQRVDSEGLYRDPVLVVDPGMHVAAIRSMDVDAAGRFLVTGSDDKTVRIWSAADGHLLRTIFIPAGPGNIGKVFAVAISPDGKIVAAGGWTDESNGKERVYLFDRVTGDEIMRRTDIQGAINHLAFSKDVTGSKLAASLSSAGVRLFSSPALQQIGTDPAYDGASYGIAFARDGRIAATADDGKLRLYDPSLHLVTEPVIAPDGQRPFNIAFSPDGDRLAVGYRDTTHVTILNSTQLRKIASPNTSRAINGTLSATTWALDGRTLYAGGRWVSGDDTPVLAWSRSGVGPVREILGAKDTVKALSALPNGRLAVASAEPRINLVGPTGQSLWQDPPVTVDYRGERDAFRTNPDGTMIRFGLDVWGKNPASFSLRDRNFDTRPSSNSDLAAPRVTGLDINWKNTTTPTLAGLALPIDDYEMSRSVAIDVKASAFILGSEWSIRKFDATGKLLWNVPAPDAAWAVNITPDGRLAIAACGDGTIRWYRMDNGKELLAFFLHIDGKRWVAWTPLGYYMASPGGEDLIKWQINREPNQAPEFFDASRFRDQFFRPDVVERVLDELDPQKALEAADRARHKQTVQKSILSQTPPRVSIIDPVSGTRVENADLTIDYIVQDQPGTVIRRLRLLQDGVLATETHDLTIPDSGSLSGSFHITLQGEDPTLKMVANSVNGDSDLAIVQIRHHAATPDDFKPNLYAVVVGVSEFRNNPGLALHYAALDAHDVANRLRLQKGLLYRDVQVRELVDAKATQAEIDSALEWVERSTNTKDVAVLFFSTHGETDGNRNFYLLPYDANTSDEISLRHTSTKGSDLLETVHRLSEHGKTLVFLDACHSGSIFKAGPTDIDKYAHELGSAQSGAIVFTSSTGTELAAEPPDLGHGILTAALLEALDGKSDRSTRFLSPGDLEAWFNEEIFRLSHGAQHPNAFNTTQHFNDPRVFVTAATP